MKIKKTKNKLDEMQEQKLLKSESLGFWIAFWGLFAAMFIQIFLYGRDFKTIAGEWIVFMCIALYSVITSLKNGIWSKVFAPTLEVNLAVSALGGAFSGIFLGVATYREYHALAGSIATGIVYFSVVFSACFVALSFAMHLYKKRVNRLENEEGEEREIDGK